MISLKVELISLITADSSKACSKPSFQLNNEPKEIKK